MSSAARYYEQITARIRAGFIPDALADKTRHHSGVCRQRRYTPEMKQHIKHLLDGGQLTHRAIAERLDCSISMVGALARQRGGCIHLRVRTTAL